ncbi:MAG: site-specific DNA-methyltransferase [Clostridiales bacterium]|nr:site-specific DNA-methyltransferase [Clostridiales bacterium]
MQNQKLFQKARQRRRCPCQEEEQGRARAVQRNRSRTRSSKATPGKRELTKLKFPAGEKSNTGFEKNSNAQKSKTKSSRHIPSFLDMVAEELLALEFGELKDFGFNLELTGFDPKEIEKLFADDGNTVQDDNFDLTAALEEAAFVLPGDVWTLGRHRLICGDATDADTVRRLMDGRKANLVLTDPPYNVDFKSSGGLKIRNDSQKSDQFYAFLLSAFRNLADSLESGGSAYIFHADTEGENFRRAFREAGFHLSGTCIWVKDSFVMGRSPYQWQHEPILYGWLKTGTHKWYAGRSEATVWNFSKPVKNSDHPTSKPLDLLAYPIRNSSQANGIVLDTFGGSGSTLIACEQTDRICRMMELDEKYASVILRRYAEFKQNGGADISCERDGRTYAYADLVKSVSREA